MSPVTEYTTDTFKIHQLEEDDNDNNDYTKNSGENENVDKNDDENDDKNDDENNDYYGDGVN